MKKNPDSSEKDNNDARADRLLDLARFEALQERVNRLGEQVQASRSHTKRRKMRFLNLKTAAGIALIIAACYFLTTDRGELDQTPDFTQLRKLDNRRGMASDDILLLIAGRQYQKLLDTLRNAPNTDINNEYRALALMHTGRFEEAIQPLKQIIENNHTQFVEEAFLDIVRCYKNSKQIDEAEAIIKRMEMNKYISPKTIEAAKSLL